MHTYQRKKEDIVIEWTRKSVLKRNKIVPKGNLDEAKNGGMGDVFGRSC